MSRRVEQFAATLQTALQETISRGLQDPRISGLITITGVRVSDDFKTAIVNVSILPAERQELTMHGLKSAASHLRHQIGDKISSRQMPELVFKLDQSLKKQAGVMEALAKARQEREAKSGETPDRAYAPGEEHEKDHPR